MKADSFILRLAKKFPLVLISVFFITVVAVADDFTPTKPVTVVAPASPGGGSDVLARTIAQIITSEKFTTQPLIVQNLPGAGQAIGLTQVFQQKGNAHMFAVANPASVAGLLVAGKDAPKIKDFSIIAQLALDEQLLVVKSDSRYKTIKDAIAESRKKENSISIAGADQADRVCSRLLEKAAGIKVRYVQFNSGGECITALLGGQVDMMWANPPEFIGQYEAKMVRPIALAQDKRIKQFKDVPTFKENGINIVFKFFRGVIAPPGLSASEVAYYEKILKKMVATKAWKDGYLSKNMLSPAWQSGKDFSKTVNDSNKLFTDTLTELGLIK